MKSNMVIAATAALTIAATGVAKAEPQAEVLHWWTSGGEAKSVAVLQEEFSSRGGTWTDMPVAGGGGDAAMTALRARVLAGNAPTAVQLKGPAIQEWYEEGVLADISAVAKKHGWADVLPASIAGHMKCEGTWCAAQIQSGELSLDRQKTARISTLRPSRASGFPRLDERQLKRGMALLRIVISELTSKCLSSWSRNSGALEGLGV